LRGAFYVSDREEPVPKSYRELWIGPSPEAAQVAKIEATGMQSGRPLLTTSLAVDRTASEALTGMLIYVDAARVPRDDAPLWIELPGAKVIDAAGVTIGAVDHVYNSGASDVVVVRREDGKTLDVALAPPYVAGEESFVEGEIRLAVSADVFEELWS